MKGTSRPFLNFLRSWGFRGPPDEARMGLAPTITPVALVANEPEGLPRYWARVYVGTVALINVLELVSPVACRIREIFAGSQTASHVVFTHGANLITANAAAISIGSSTGQPSRSAVRSGTIGAALPAGVGMFNLGIETPVTGTNAQKHQDPWILPPRRRLYIAASNAIAGTWNYASVIWEELGD